MEYNVRIILTLRDDTKDISELAAMFPVKPDLVAARGSRDAKRMIPRTSHVSFYSHAESWSSTIDEHWAGFAKTIAKNRAVFLGVSETATMKITILVDHKGRFPSLYIPEELVRFAASVGSALDIDVHEDEPSS